MLKIVGDGSYTGTIITDDDIPILVSEVTIYCSKETDVEVYCLIEAESEWRKYPSENISIIALNGVYKFISDGQYNNSRLFFAGEMLRGVQAVEITLNHTQPTITIHAVYMPNVVERKEE